MATSSGMAVISTREATHAPMLPPTIMPTRIRPRFPTSSEASVATYGDQHTRDAIEVPAPGSLLVAQSTEAEDEQDAGYDICSDNDAVVHARPLSLKHLSTYAG